MFLRSAYDVITFVCCFFLLKNNKISVRGESLNDNKKQSKHLIAAETAYVDSITTTIGYFLPHVSVSKAEKCFFLSRVFF
jgi:hypothetical protein